MVSRQIFLFALTFSLASNCAEKLPDRCSRFKGFLVNSTLVECPQAKFMVKDDLFECYDKDYKDTGRYKIVAYIDSIFFFAYLHKTAYFRIWIKLRM